MRTKHLIIISLFLFSPMLIAQQLTLGIQGGGNSSFYSISGDKNSGSFRAYMFGAFADITFGKLFSLCVEGNYMKKGGELRRGLSNDYGTPHTTSISIPLLAKVKFKLPKVHLYLNAGPRLDISVEENDERFIGLYENKKSAYFGASVGAGLNILFRKDRYLGFEIRYSPDFTGFPVNAYTTNGITTAYIDNAIFKNNSIELIAKIGFDVK